MELAVLIPPETPLPALFQCIEMLFCFRRVRQVDFLVILNNGFKLCFLETLATKRFPEFSDVLVLGKGTLDNWFAPRHGEENVHLFLRLIFERDVCHVINLMAVNPHEFLKAIVV